MIKPESETANKVEHLKARIHEAVSSSDPGIVIFAVIIAAQLIVGTLGLALDRLYGGATEALMSRGRRLWHQMSKDRRTSLTYGQQFQRSGLPVIWFKIVDRHNQHCHD